MSFEQISSLEKKFLDDLQHCYNQLANESKKKFPSIKEACETGIIRVRNASSSNAILSIGLQKSLVNESAQIMEPFFMACDTKSQKLVQISLHSIQKCILFQCLNAESANNLINCLWNLMENGLEEVKLLQTITLLISTNKLVVDNQLSKTLALCFRLHHTKNLTINNTASATIRQLMTVIFERVPPNLEPTNKRIKDKCKKFKAISYENSDSYRYIPIELNQTALDAYNIIHDLVQIVNGELPFWIKYPNEISKIFGLELLELIIDQYPQIFYQYEEFIFLLKEKVCPIIIKLFSPNIKQRSHLSLNPIFKQSPGHNNDNNTNYNNNTAQLMSNQTPIWPMTVRLMRIVSVLIKNYFELIITESEIFLSLLIKSLEADKFNWQRLTALEALYKIIHPKILVSLCTYYDMKQQSSKILRDIVNSLCIFIQSQFQVVDSSTTQSLIASLVNNNNSGNNTVAYSNINNNSNNFSSVLNRTNFPMFNLRGISISLLFIPMNKEHRYKTFYIDQLDKLDPPTAPDGHGLSTAISCVFEIVTALIKIVENDLNVLIDTNFNNNSSSKPITMDNLNEETMQLHKSMLNSTFTGLVGTFSLLLDASVNETITELILERMRKLIVIYGIYDAPIARDFLLISMSKSSLPSNYYTLPVLNPEILFGEEAKLNDSNSASVNVFSISSIANNAINLSNLLSQQNNQPQTNLTNPNSKANLSNIETNSANFYDANRQIIAVGTQLPNNQCTNNFQQGPVMLNAKNLQCMNSLMHISMTYAFVYEEKSWLIVFTTLQHLTWILGIKPSNINAFKLNQHYSNQNLMQTTLSNKNSQESNNLNNNDTAMLPSTDLPVLSTMLSRLFECTHYNIISEHLSSIFINTQNISNESLNIMVKALITLSNEAMEIAYNNREPSLFAVVKIHESSMVNLKRINLFWDSISSHLIQVSSHPYNKLRECGVEVLCNLVKSVLDYIYVNRKNQSDKEFLLNESYYLMSLQLLSETKFIDIRQKQIEYLLIILQTNGEDINDGWPIVLNIIESACIPQNENLIVHAFQCYEFIVSNLLRYIPSIYLIHCVNASVSFGLQLQELNVSLSAVGLIWNVADFLFSNQEPIQLSIEEYSKHGHKFISIDLPICENLTPFQSLWISLFKNLSNLCTDARLSVRKSSVQTLMSTLSQHGQILDYNTWKAIFFYVLYPLIESVRTLSSLASNEKITQSESSKPNSCENSEFMIHYSRNTAFKQWCETQVSVINGITRILSLKLNMLISFVVNSDLFITNKNSEEELNENEKILFRIWKSYFEFICTSSTFSNAEVSISAIKCFNEIIGFLDEYEKNHFFYQKKELQREAPFLELIWKIILKTWFNIGEYVSMNKACHLDYEDGNVEKSPSQGNLNSNLTIFEPSQSFLCFLVNPLFIIFTKNVAHFSESDFNKMSIIIQNIISIPYESNESYHQTQNDYNLTSLQYEVMITIEKIHQQIVTNLNSNSNLLPLIFYQYLALSLYAVNIVPPKLNVFISPQFQHRALHADLTTNKSSVFNSFGEIALKNAYNLYQYTHSETIVIKTHILHLMIKTFQIPLRFKYACPQQTTWKYAVNYFIKTLELGLPMARHFPNDFNSIWADLASTFECFLFPSNKPPANQSLEEQQMDESLDVKVVELIRDHIMIHAQKIPKEFLLQIVSILNRGSIHSPSVTSIESEINRKLREDFARICFQTLLQFSFFGPKGNPDLFIQSKTNLNESTPDQTIGIVNKLAVASILKRFNDVIIKYVEDEKRCPCPLPRHRLSEISFVLKALATLISSLKEAPQGVVENHVWQQLIELYPLIVDCTMSNSAQMNVSIREVLHQYAYLLKCPINSFLNKQHVDINGMAELSSSLQTELKIKDTKQINFSSIQQNGNSSNEINI